MYILILYFFQSKGAAIKPPAKIFNFKSMPIPKAPLKTVSEADKKYAADKLLELEMGK